MIGYNRSPARSAPNWPLEISINPSQPGGPGPVVKIFPGITTIVGPNGSGKTRALRVIKRALEGRNGPLRDGQKTHLLAAGRSSPIENYKGPMNDSGRAYLLEAPVGSTDEITNWWKFESIVGSLLALQSRADLRLKITTRIAQLFDRKVELHWTQTGLNAKFSSSSGGTSYSAAHEASGILHLMALLAAIHNDQIGALIVDEPEISLHPQHQAFLLEEMEKVAGDPSELERKIIIIATHSASMIPLRRISELPTIAFFSPRQEAPTQIAAEADILKRTKLAALVARLTTTHRTAMFAERVLLVEGPSDEIVATQVARRLEMRLLARNAQILPVTGKSEFTEAAKLFGLINKKVAVLADLDALADDNTLVLYFSQLPEAAAISDRIARKNLADLDGDLRSSLLGFMNRYQEEIDAAALTYNAWSDRDECVFTKRVTLARVLTDPASFGGAAAAEASRLSIQYRVLLDAIAELGCFFLRRGAIENYYKSTVTDFSKPNAAADEAAEFGTHGIEDIRSNYHDVVVALNYIAPNQHINEDKLLRPKLAAILAATLQSMAQDSTDSALGDIVRETIGDDAYIFSLTNKSQEHLRIAVNISSPLFRRERFPFEISVGDDINKIVKEKLPDTY